MATNTQQESTLDQAVSWGLVVLGAIVGIGAVVRIFASDQSVSNRVDQTTLLYVAVGAAILLLRNVKSLSFGDYKLEFQELKKATGDAKLAARLAEDAAMFGIPATATATHAALESANVQAGPTPDDPWKGQFGNQSESNGRRLTASVQTLTSRPDWFAINLVVEAISPGVKPIAGDVQFFLHDSFPNPTPVVPVGPDGRARLHMTSWGAFTVGAVADNGQTKLELDLATLPDAPMEFRTR